MISLPCGNFIYFVQIIIKKITFPEYSQVLGGVKGQGCDSLLIVYIRDNDDDCKRNTTLLAPLSHWIL
jgi:hypothetical protein